MSLVLLTFLFFIIAIAYSSAGFGGGSSYLALLSMTLIGHDQLRILALICNILVVSGSVILLYRAGKFDHINVWPIIILSIPMAYLGGKVQLKEDTFFILLGFTLVLAATFMIAQPRDRKLHIPVYGNTILGGAIGLLSGLVGIGGGIFLSPILHITQWSKAISIAACTALFILVNSVAGLAGQLHEISIDFRYEYLYLFLAVLIGGQIGIRFSISQFTAKTIRLISAFLILIVGLRLLYRFLILNWLL